MGCNSVLAIEVREESQNWEVYALDLLERRDYTLYGYVAGVRGEYGPLYEARGLPRDITTESKKVFKGYHTPTWLNYEEFHKCLIECFGVSDISSSKSWISLDLILFALSKVYGPDNVRLIIAFN